MKKKGNELEFISQIKRDGSGIAPVAEDYLPVLHKAEFELRRLSLSEDTFIATGFNSFVVRVKPSIKPNEVTKEITLQPSVINSIKEILIQVADWRKCSVTVLDSMAQEATGLLIEFENATQQEN